MKYKCFREFKVKTLTDGREVIIPPSAELIRLGDFLYYKNLPICVWRSQIAKDNLIWNGDGQADKRLEYESRILFSSRKKTWTEYNGKDTITRSARFTPTEFEYMTDHFPQFFTEDGLFNDYFFVGSHISELKELADYLN